MMGRGCLDRAAKAGLFYVRRLELGRNLQNLRLRRSSRGVADLSEAGSLIETDGFHLHSGIY